MRKRAIERSVLLTNEDLQDAALRLPGFGVARAEVLVRYDTAFPRETVRGTRTLIVIPRRDPKTPPPPVPQAYLDAVEEKLAPQRLLGERLLVSGPVYAKIGMDIRVKTEPGADREKVGDCIKKLIGKRLTDLRHEGDIEPWPLGRPVTAGEIKGLVASIPDVIAVPHCRLARVGTVPNSKEIALDPAEIAIAHPENIDLRIEPPTGWSA